MPDDRSRFVRGDGRVRKRAPNACVRCRKQKIKCSGQVPCEQCSKRAIHCDFDTAQQKILVTQSYIAELQQRAAVAGNNNAAPVDHEIEDHESEQGSNESGHLAERRQEVAAAVHDDTVTEHHESEGYDRTNAHTTPDADHQEHGIRSTPAAGLTNPLDPINSDGFTLNNANRRYYLGVSSNWSFGRRVSNMVYSKVHGTSLPSTAHLLEGLTYNLGWDGQRTSAAVDITVVPTADFATYLINAVKFHCGRLFHMFDEATFMHHFKAYYEDPRDQTHYPRLWFVHFLIILAFGKAFIVRSCKDKRPPGAELFVQAMQLLPDVTYMFNDTVQSIEVLCCAALYLQCLDVRSAAYAMIGQALRLAVEQGLHTDMRSLQLPETLFERCKETWWTVYILDRQMTTLMGTPLTLSEDDITASHPTFAGSISKQRALAIHIKLAEANSVILRTVYGKTGGRSQRFLASMKDALKTIAEANEELNKTHALNLRSAASNMCRLSASLHLFHHQALVLATRPLLYSFLQKRLEATRSLRVSSSRGARSLIRVCVGSAQQSLDILEALQSQGLLESFVPFDREATYSSAIIIAVASAVDSSLVKDRDIRLSAAYNLLDEMMACGNLIAEHQKRELEQLDIDLTKLQTSYTMTQPLAVNNTVTPESTASYPAASIDGPLVGSQVAADFDFGNLLMEWDSEDGLSSQQLLEVADSLDFGQLSWPTMGDLDGWS